MKKEILIVTLLPDKGTTGVQSHFNSLSKYFSETSIDHRIITPSSYKAKLLLRILGRLNRKIFLIHKEFSILLGREINLALIANNLKKYIKDQNQETTYFIYAQDPSTALLLASLKNELNIANVTLICHFNISESYEYTLQRNTQENALLGKYLFKKEAAALKRVDQIIFPSFYIQKHVLARNSNILEKSRVIPNFTDLITYPKNMAYPEVDFISIGTLETRKNQQFAIKIIYELHKLGYKKSLMLVGDGPDRKMLEQLRDELGLSNYVTFTGYIPNAKELIANGKIFLHTAFLENLSIAMIEALSQKKPIIAPKTGGNPEIFQDKIEGFYLDFEDVKKSAEAIIPLFDNCVYERMSCNAFQRFQKVFSTNIAAPLFKTAILGQMQ